MASPPNMATSPPYPSHATLPTASKKRPSISTTDMNNPSKRRKPSMTSSTSMTSGFHPLRQTSFPPEVSPLPSSGDPNVQYSRSPSVDSAMTSNSMRPRGGGRKSSLMPDGSSVRGRRSRANASIDGASITRGGGGSKSGKERDETAAPEDDEDEEDEPDMNAVKGLQQTDEDVERAKLKILMEHFTNDQDDRYDAFRRGRLSLPILKRLVNQTLSQSIADPVAKTIAGFTKVFIGEIIERARDVQEQWAAAEAASFASSDNASTNNTHQNDNSNSVNMHTQTQTPTPQATQSTPSSQSQDPNRNQGASNETGEKPTKETPPPRKKEYLGPLLPDHLREALRRYRRDQEGGAAGMKMRSLGGMRGYPAATGGRRLFH